ncbi:RNA polymerase subunit sigma [Psychrobacillus sp. MER TA 17]|nr:RNA polymerase subunit sigma [Psychrobacillus sp. MER TA 17]
MAVSNYDYPALSQPQQVRLLLSDIHALQARANSGDYTAVDVLVDLGAAIKQANLTRRQREALHYVYLRDMTQSAAAAEMESRQQRVADYVAGAEQKIADVYYYWAGHKEGYDV